MTLFTTLASLAIGAALTATFIARRVLTRKQPSMTARPRPARPVTAVPGDKPAITVEPFTRTLELAPLQAVSGPLTGRLWAHAFGVQPGAALPAEYLEARQSLMSRLLDEKLNPTHLPRRPELMPKLMSAVTDIRASREKVSRIIAQDPVLAADVLKLSNSPLYRLTATPVESIQRAVVICGEDGLRALLATALVKPIFRTADKNFPRFINMLWARSEQAARISEIYAADVLRADRFEAQLLALLSALGPLVVYRAVIEFYAKSGAAPNPCVCAALVSEFGAGMARRVAAFWETSPRLIGALEELPEERGLTSALYVGEFLATLALVEAEETLTSETRQAQTDAAGLPTALTAHIEQRLLAKIEQAKALVPVSAEELARSENASLASSSPAVRALSGGRKPAAQPPAQTAAKTPAVRPRGSAAQSRTLGTATPRIRPARDPGRVEDRAPRRVSSAVARA